MAANNEIILRLEQYLINGGSVSAPQSGSGVQGSGHNFNVMPGSLPSQQRSQESAVGFSGGAMAHLAITYGSRIIGMTGNQELANGIRETAEWGFLGMRALTGSPVAIATLAMKASTKALELLMNYIEEQRAIAQKYNERDLLLLRSGQIRITTDTQISYGKYRRRTFK